MPSLRKRPFLLWSALVLGAIVGDLALGGEVSAPWPLRYACASDSLQGVSDGTGLRVQASFREEVRKTSQKEEDAQKRDPWRKEKGAWLTTYPYDEHIQEIGSTRVDWVNGAKVLITCHLRGKRLDTIADLLTFSRDPKDTDVLVRPFNVKPSDRGKPVDWTDVARRPWLRSLRTLKDDWGREHRLECTASYDGQAIGAESPHPDWDRNEVLRRSLTVDFIQGMIASKAQLLIRSETSPERCAAARAGQVVEALKPGGQRPVSCPGR